MELTGLLAVVSVLAMLVGSAALFGADSRDGNDWMDHRSR